MKAIMVNSGRGTRMGEYTQERPKCLLDLVEGETVLSRQIKALIGNDITDIIITTGAFADQIEKYIKTSFPDLGVTYVHNPRYASTNYIYSLYLTKEKVLSGKDPIYFMHGDLVFEPSVLELLIDSASPTAAIVDSSVPLPPKDFKARIEEGHITSISVALNEPNCYFLAPLYKFSAEAFELWMQEIAKFVSRGNTGVYAEDALESIYGQIALVPLDIQGRLCREVDTYQDLLEVRAYLSARKG